MRCQRYGNWNTYCDGYPELCSDCQEFQKMKTISEEEKKKERLIQEQQMSSLPWIEVMAETRE